MKINVAEKIAEVRKLFKSKKNWIKGRFSNEDGGFCLLGGIYKVDNKIQELRSVMCDIVRRGIARKKKVKLSKVTSILSFNDNPRTKFEDVKISLDYAERYAKRHNVTVQI